MTPPASQAQQQQTFAKDVGKKEIVIGTELDIKDKFLQRLIEHPENPEFPAHFSKHLRQAWLTQREPGLEPQDLFDIERQEKFLMDSLLGWRSHPPLLTPQMVAYLNAPDTPRSIPGLPPIKEYGLPITRFMGMVWALSPMRYYLDLRTEKGCRDFYRDLATDIGPKIRASGPFFPDFIFEDLSKQVAGFPIVPGTPYVTTQGMLDIANLFITDHQFIPGDRKNYISFILKFLTLMTIKEVDERLLPKGLRDYLHTKRYPTRNPNLFITNFMAEILIMGDVCQEEDFNDLDQARKLAIQFLSVVLPKLRMPFEWAYPYYEMAILVRENKQDYVDFELTNLWEHPYYEMAILVRENKQDYVDFELTNLWEHRYLVLYRIKPHPIRLIEEEMSVGLIGPADVQNGLGAGVRKMAEGLLDAGITPQVLTRYSVTRAPVMDGALNKNLVNKISAPVNILHFNPDVNISNLMAVGVQNIVHRYNIGYYVWETGKLTRAHHQGLDLVDEIWTPTQFLYTIFSEASKRPVYLLPTAVTVPEIPEKMNRAYFCLEEDVFYFLFTYDTLSWLSRKNPLGVVQAFLQAFPKDKKVGLILKTQNAEVDLQATETGLQQQLGRLVKTDDRLRIINKTHRSVEVAALMKACDAYVSLHRCEGFGYGMAEAMLLGRPVIATGWSGNTDFITPETACPVRYKMLDIGLQNFGYLSNEIDHQWADPDLAHAAEWMIKIREDHTFRQKISRAGQAFIQEKYNPQAIGEKYRARLTDIFTKLGQAARSE